MTRSRALTTAILLASLALFSVPQSVSAAPVTERVLQNGLKVIVDEDHKVPLAVFEICYRVGSMDDPSGRTGLSHMLEHMMFKGTPKYGSKVFSKLVMKYGGTDNAFTSENMTCYHQELPSDRIQLSVDLESDRMHNLLLDEKEFQSERDVVAEERRMRVDDNPEASLDEEVDAISFLVHPYHHPVIGWMSEIKAYTRADLVAYYRKYYSPEDALIIVEGDVDPVKLMDEIGATFGRLGNPEGPVVRDRIEEPEQHGERRAVLRRAAELPSVIEAWHAPVLPDPDAYALDVLAEVLGGGKSSRLYHSLVYEKKLALGVSADYQDLSRDPYLFEISATAASGVDPAELERQIYAEVDRLKAGPPTDFELQKAENSIEASFVKQQDSIYAKTQVLAQFELMGGGWRERDAYTSHIRAVTAADVQRVANKYLTGDNRTAGMLVPTGEAPEAPSRPSTGGPIR